MITKIRITRIRDESYQGEIFVEGGLMGLATGPTWQGVMDMCAEIAHKWEKERS